MLVAGNWKMHMTLDGARALARGVAEGLGNPAPVGVVLCPPFVYLDAVFTTLRGSAVRLGAQDIHNEDQGAFTGEVSAPMLRSVGCDYVILGHSERRQYFGETDEGVQKKVRQALRHDLIPIICVGEKLEERRAGDEQEVVGRQIEAALEGVEHLAGPDAIVVAYEPVWAIGTGENATPEQAQAMHAFLRERIEARFGGSASRGIQILYGGSVKPGNAIDLFGQPDVDGGLIGGASLKVEDFVAIVQAAQLVAA